MTILSKQQMKDFDFQFLGGDWKQASELVKDYPALRRRWSYEHVCEMYNLLAGLEMEGFSKKGLVFLYQYMEIRGDEGELRHCRAYNTSEYCVMLWLMRQEEYKMKRRQENAEKA